MPKRLVKCAPASVVGQASTTTTISAWVVHAICGFNRAAISDGIGTPRWRRRSAFIGWRKPSAAWSYQLIPAKEFRFSRLNTLCRVASRPGPRKRGGRRARALRQRGVGRCRGDRASINSAAACAARWRPRWRAERRAATCRCRPRPRARQSGRRLPRPRPGGRATGRSPARGRRGR